MKYAWRDFEHFIGSTTSCIILCDLEQVWYIFERGAWHTRDNG